MLCTLPFGALSRFSGACVLLTTPPLASPRPPVPASVFRLSSSALGTWSHWCASAPLFLHPAPCHVGISPGSPPSSLHRWLSREVSPRLHRAMVSDLHGVLVNTLSLSGKTLCTPLTHILLPFVFGALPAGAMTTHPLAVPLRVRKRLRCRLPVRV